MYRNFNNFVIAISEKQKGHEQQDYNNTILQVEIDLNINRAVEWAGDINATIDRSNIFSVMETTLYMDGSSKSKKAFVIGEKKESKICLWFCF